MLLKALRPDFVFVHRSHSLAEIRHSGDVCNSANVTRTITAMQARMKNPELIIPNAMQALQALANSAEQGGVPAQTLEFVHLRASQINSCSVCVDMSFRFKNPRRQSRNTNAHTGRCCSSRSLRVRVNCIAPETILTERNQQHIPEGRIQSLIDMHPIKRLGTPEDVARAALFLASAVPAIVLPVATAVTLRLPRPWAHRHALPVNTGEEQCIQRELTLRSCAAF